MLKEREILSFLEKIKELYSNDATLLEYVSKATRESLAAADEHINYVTKHTNDFLVNAVSTIKDLTENDGKETLEQARLHIKRKEFYEEWAETYHNLNP